MLLRSNDVLHDFWVPEFRAKMDAVPGMITYFWFTPTRIQARALRGRLRRTLRQGPLHHARLGEGRHARRLPVLARHAAHLGGRAGGHRTQRHEPGGESSGREIWAAEGCNACHSLDGSAVVGPSWLNLWNTTRNLADGTTTTVDEAYFVESIREPAVKIVEGFSPAMIAYDEATVTEDEIQALIALLKESVDAPADAADGP